MKADRKFGQFLDTYGPRPKFVAFGFAGRIHQTARGDVLVISDMSEIREVDRPKWMSDLYRK